MDHNDSGNTIGVNAPPATSALYLAAHESFADFARTLTPDEWAAPVPCTPAWTARDVLSHVSGLADDALAGRMEGAPGEEWTAAQIVRNRDHSVDELLARWEAQADELASALDLIGEHRPPFDCHSHEHDVRHAIGQPGGHDSIVTEVAGFGLAGGFSTPFSVTIELADGRTVMSGGEAGAGGGVVLRGVSAFELFRSRLGRRTREQVRGYAWDGSDDEIEAVIDGWFTFGPSLVTIDE